MHVVSAGVHISIGSGIGNTGGLLYRQTIEIRAQQSGGSIAIAEDGDHPITPDVLYYLAVKIGELGADATGGSLFLVGKLGVAVQVLIKVLLPLQIGLLGSDELGDAGRIRHGFTP